MTQLAADLGFEQLGLAPKAHVLSSTHGMILGSSSEPSLLVSFLRSLFPWAVHAKRGHSVLLCSLGLEAMDEPWVDWVGGQKEERQGQDEETDVAVNETRKWRCRQGHGSKLGESVGRRVKKRLTVNDQERQQASPRHKTWTHLGAVQLESSDCQRSKPFSVGDGKTNQAEWLYTSWHLVQADIDRISVVRYSKR